MTVGQCGAEVNFREVSGCLEVKCSERRVTMSLFKVDHEKAVRLYCESCRIKTQPLTLELWTGPDGKDYLIHPDGSCEPLRGRW